MRFSKILLLSAVFAMMNTQHEFAHGDAATEINLSDIIVISDIDDTIHWSHILNPAAALIDAPQPKLAFKGMPELYTALAHKGAKFIYVTGALDPLIPILEKNSIPDQIIKKNHFPDGPTFLYKAENASQIGESIEDFKVIKITEIMKANPTAHFILIGDNGQKDILSYKRIREDKTIGSRVLQVYIHKIYTGGLSLELDPDPSSLQHPFITAAELAAQFYGFNLITADELKNVATVVDKGMHAFREKNRNLTLPYAAEMKVEQVDAIFQTLPAGLNSVQPLVNTSIPGDSQKILNDIHTEISKRLLKPPRIF